MNQVPPTDTFRSTYSGGDLLDQSRAKPPAMLDWEKIESNLAATRAASKSHPKPHYDSDAYLKQCREEDPWPQDAQQATGTLSLSDCRFAYPCSILPDCNARVLCKVHQSEPPLKGVLSFKLWLRRVGESDWTDLCEGSDVSLEAKPGDSEVDAVLRLHCPTPPPPLGTKLEYRVSVENVSGAKAESAPVLVVLQNFTRYVGAPYLSYQDRNIVPVLDEDGKWAHGLAALIKEQAQKAGSSLVAFGFAQGQSARELAKHRAEWVRCVLSRDKAAWDVLRGKMNTRDLQAILSGLALGFDWSCDPGAVDGKAGDKTTNAIKSFQKETKDRLGMQMESDGKPGKTTWEAALDALCRAVGAAMGDPVKTNPSWQVPVWGHSAGKGVYSNGADLSRDPEVGVEICLFEPGMEPALKVAAAGKKVDTTSNPTEDPAVIKKFPLFVPDPEKQQNKVRRVRMVGMIFDADKGFLLPHALPGIRTIVAMHKEFPQAKILVVGHAESDEIHAGIDLARHRAEMLTAYLVGREDPWLACFAPSQIAASRWGIREIQLMLSALDNGGKPFFEGCASGILDEKTKVALKAFEKSKGLKVDGISDAKTRQELVRAYLDIEDTTITQDDIPIPHGCKGHPDKGIAAAGLVEDDRRIEVFFFEKKIKPRPRKSTSQAEDQEYISWVDGLLETRDFEIHGAHVQVVDEKKKAVAGLPVKLVGPIELESITDDHGYATFTGLKAGRYLLSSAKEDRPIPQCALNYPTAKTVSEA